MAQTYNKISRIRKLRSLSQQQLADKVGAHVITISNLERGQAPLTAEWMERLSEALQVEEGALLMVERPLRIFIGGEIGANGLDFWKGEEKYAVAYARSLPAERPISADLPRWVVVHDESLYPLFRQFDVIRLVPLLEDQPVEIELAIGRLCVAKVQGMAKEKLVVGYLQRGSGPGLISVNPISGPPLTDQKILALFLVDRAIYQPEFPEQD